MIRSNTTRGSRIGDDNQNNDIEEADDQGSSRSGSSMNSGRKNNDVDIDDEEGGVVFSSTVIHDDDDGPRFLMTESTGFKSIKSLVHQISQLANAYECDLPNEIILKNIVTFFTVKPLNPDRTKALSCSSTSGQYSLDHCLIDSESSWWISSTGTFRNGTYYI